MKYLVISNVENGRTTTFPLNRTQYAIIGDKLYVHNRGCQFRFPLDQHKYEITERKATS